MERKLKNFRKKIFNIDFDNSVRKKEDEST